MKAIRNALASVLLSGSMLQAEVTFTQKPTAVKDGDKMNVVFTVGVPTDVEVAVLAADGKVVRHLAAGVLGGKEPPPAPLKAGLAQSLEWDAKDDFGKPAAGGPFKVRVRAGMGVKFGKLIGDGHCNLLFSECHGLSVDKNGDLYLLACLTGAVERSFFLRVFDREGNYLREILPWSANLPPEAQERLGCLRLAGEDRWVPRNNFSLWPVFYPGVNRLAGFNPRNGSVVLLGDTRICQIGKQDGALADPNGIRPFDWVGKKSARKDSLSGVVGATSGAYSPDGAWFYITGLAAEKNEAWPDGSVYRMNAETGKCEPFIKVAMPEGQPSFVKGAWDRSDSKTALHGIGVDTQGRIILCDAANGKVRQFDPDGKETVAVDVPHAYEAAVDPKSGVLYVLTRWQTGNNLWQRSVVKVAALQAGAAVVDTLDFGISELGECALAADFSAKDPQLWVAGCRGRSSVLRLRDEGGKLAVVDDLSDRDKLACGTATRLAVDDEADLVYVSDGKDSNYQYDGLTGRYAGKVDQKGRPEPIYASELCVRRDGVVYAGGSKLSYSGRFLLLDRSLKPLPYPGGEKGGFGHFYGRAGGNYFGNHGCSVRPDGSLFVCAMFDWSVYCVYEIGPEGKGVQHPRLKGFFSANKDPRASDSRAYEKDGIDSALIGTVPGQCGGLVAGPGRHVYLGLGLLPRDYKLPDGLDKIEAYRGSVGSVIKFRPAGGAVWPDDGRNGKDWGPLRPQLPPLRIPEKFEDGVSMGPTVGLRNTFIEGAIRAYPGLAVFSGGHGECVCQTPRFDVDDFGRVYIPNALTCSVTVVDDAGNTILRFGGYGNHDSRGPGPDSPVKTPEIPLAYPCSVQASFKHIYVADSANRRVVRVDPTYAAEEICAVP